MVVIIFFLLIIVLAVIIRFVKKLVRTIIIVAVIILIIGASAYVFTDAMNLKNNFISKEKLLVLDMDGKIVAAVISKDVSVPVPVTTIGNLNELYSKKEFDSMRGDKHKLLIFTWTAFNDLDVIGEEEYIFSMTDAKTILESDSPKQFIIDKMVSEQGKELEFIITKEVNEMFPTNDHFKSVIFSFMLAKKQNSVFTEYIKGNIFIYPNTIVLQMIKILPISWVNSFLPENNL